jgi:dipeptidyl aminopeptidase/acylaminoacyl peptidase
VLSDPVVSRDGRRVAYVTQTHGFALREIMLDGSGEHPLAAAKVDDHSVAWAPRGHQFVFARQNDIVLRDRGGVREQCC